MKIYYNEQFVRQSMMPLLEEIFTDMAAPWGEEAKGTYLKKLLIPSPLTAAEKEHFRWDYFAPARAIEKRPFTASTDQDAHQRELFLKLLSDTLTFRLRLFGRRNIEERLFPSEDKSFDSNTELRSRIFRLAYLYMHHFEEVQLRQMLPSNVNDEEKIEQEAKIQNGQMKILQIDIAGKMQEFIVQNKELELLKNTFNSGTSSPSSNPVRQKAITAIEKEFRLTQQIALEEMLEQHGLEITEPAVVWDNGIATVKVVDVSGQLLDIKVNLYASEDDPHKYTFTFTGKAAANLPDRSGTTFSLSHKDLKKLFLDYQGKPKTAEEVLQEKFGFKPFKEQESAPPKENLPFRQFDQKNLPLENKDVDPQMNMAGSLPLTRPDTEIIEKTSVAKNSFFLSNKRPQKYFVKPKKTAQWFIQNKPTTNVITPQASQQKVDFLNVVANKIKLQQQQQQERFTALVRQKNIASQQIQAQSKQQQKMSRGAKMAIGAGVIGGGTFGSTLLMAYHALSSQSGTVSQIVDLVHWCWQHFCLA